MTWMHIGISVAGTGHVATGAPCQDVHRCVVRRSAADRETLIAVASDGAGGAARGGEGAAIVVDCLLGQAGDWIEAGGSAGGIDRARVLGWVETVRARIAAVASVEGCAVREYSATMLLAIVDDSGAAFAQIGDGVVFAAMSPGDWQAQIRPQRGDTPSQTWFVVSADARERLELRTFPTPPIAVAMTTDGLQGVLLDEAAQRADAPLLEALVERLRDAGGAAEAAAMRSWLGFWMSWRAFTAAVGDDLTLVLAVRPVAAGATALTPESAA